MTTCRVAFNAGYHAEERRLEKEDNGNGALPP